MLIWHLLSSFFSCCCCAYCSRIAILFRCLTWLRLRLRLRLRWSAFVKCDAWNFHDCLLWLLNSILVFGVDSWFWLRIVVKILFLLLLCMYCLRFVMWLWCSAWLRLRLCGKFCARQIVVWRMLNFAEPNFCWFCSIMIRAVLFYCTNFDMQSIVFDNCALLFCSTDFQL